MVAAEVAATFRRRVSKLVLINAIGPVARRHARYPTSS
jgi:pimeloyl-ACP methyl ester carboxylesterase